MSDKLDLKKCILCQRVVRRGKNDSYHFDSPQGGTVCLSCVSKQEGVSLLDWRYAREHTDSKLILGPWSRNASLDALPENKRQRFIGRTDILALEPRKSEAEPTAEPLVEEAAKKAVEQPVVEKAVAEDNPGTDDRSLFPNTDTSLSPARLRLKLNEEPKQAFERHRASGWSLPEFAALEVQVDSESRYFTRKQ